MMSSEVRRRFCTMSIQSIINMRIKNERRTQLVMGVILKSLESEEIISKVIE
jgi:hypothetical protein